METLTLKMIEVNMLGIILKKTDNSFENEGVCVNSKLYDVKRLEIGQQYINDELLVLE